VPVLVQEAWATRARHSHLGLIAQIFIPWFTPVFVVSVVGDTKEATRTRQATLRSVSLFRATAAVHVVSK